MEAEDVSGKVRFLVQDLFSVTGKGVILVGRLEAGVVRVGDRLLLDGEGRAVPFTVGGIDFYGCPPGLMEITDYPGDFGILARGISPDQAAPPCVVRSDAPDTPPPIAVWPPPPRVRPPMEPLPPLTPREVFLLSLYWLLVVVGVLFAGTMLVAVVLVLAALVDMVRHWS